nr:hypothetical protein [Tanacetum cinerariifolium]
LDNSGNDACLGSNTEVGYPSEYVDADGVDVHLNEDPIAGTGFRFLKLNEFLPPLPVPNEKRGSLSLGVL